MGNEISDESKFFYFSCSRFAKRLSSALSEHEVAMIAKWKEGMKLRSWRGSPPWLHTAIDMNAICQRDGDEPSSAYDLSDCAIRKWSRSPPALLWATGLVMPMKVQPDFDLSSNVTAQGTLYIVRRVCCHGPTCLERGSPLWLGCIS